jgi:hypothetical protein
MTDVTLRSALSLGLDKPFARRCEMEIGANGPLVSLNLVLSF